MQGVRLIDEKQDKDSRDQNMKLDNSNEVYPDNEKPLSINTLQQQQQQQQESNQFDNQNINLQKPKSIKSVDSQLMAVGDEHKYQINVFIIFAIQWIFATMLIMGQPFIFKPPIFLCDDPDNPGKTIECTEFDGGCERRLLKPGVPNSVVIEFNLYCDREWLTYACACLFFAGTCIFSLIFAQYAESGGRKKSLFISYLMGAIFILLASVAWDFWWFTIFYILSGSGFFAYTTITYVLISETASAKYMQYSTVGLLLIWAFSEMLLPFTSYLVPDWRMFLRITIGIPSILALFFFQWVYESPRFLVLKKDYGSLLLIMRKIAEVNGRIFSESMVIDPEESPSQPSSKQGSNLQIEDENIHKQNNDNNIMQLSPPPLDLIPSIEDKKTDINSYNFYDLWRFQSLRKRSISMGMLSFVSNFCYYGSMFALPNLSGNFYWNAFFLASSEYLAYVIASPVVRIFDRKSSLKVTFLSTAFFGLLLVIYKIIDRSTNCDNEDEECMNVYIETTIAIIMKFVIAVGTTVIYVYSNEIYPTAVRSLGLGLTNFAASIGSILASANEEICNEIGVSPMIAFVVLSLVSWRLLKNMPETRGQPLEDDIEEEIQRRNSSNSSNSSNNQGKEPKILVKTEEAKENNEIRDRESITKVNMFDFDGFKN